MSRATQRELDTFFSNFSEANVKPFDRANEEQLCKDCKDHGCAKHPDEDCQVPAEELAPKEPQDNPQPNYTVVSIGGKTVTLPANLSAGADGRPEANPWRRS